MVRCTGGSSSARLRSISFRALTGMTGEPAGGRRVVLGIGRGRHPRQPSAVGADHRDRLGRQLDQDAPQRVAGALDVGGEDRPADQLLQVGGRDHMIAQSRRSREPRETGSHPPRQGELGMQAAHDQSLVVGLDRQLGVAAGPQDRPDLRRRQDHRARPLDLHAQHPVANPDFQVGSHQHRALIGVGDQLDVLEDRLGAPGRNHPADHPERREQSLTVAQGPHSFDSLCWFQSFLDPLPERSREKATIG